MDDMEARTAGNTRLDLWVAFDYGSRDEIVAAVRALVEAGTEPAAIDEDAVRAHLYAPEMPDPDLVIRTSGEVRISNFLLWQSAYAELEFVPTLWPDFGRDELAAALAGLRPAPPPLRGAVSNLASRIVVAIPLGAATIYAALARRLAAGGGCVGGRADRAARVLRHGARAQAARARPGSRPSSRAWRRCTTAVSRGRRARSSGCS